MGFADKTKRQEYDRDRKAKQRLEAKTAQSTAIAEKAQALSPLAKEVMTTPSAELIALRRQRTREFKGNNFPKEPTIPCYKGEGLCLIRQSADSHFECCCQPQDCTLLVPINAKEGVENG